QHSAAIDFVDHYRGHGREFDYVWEERWIRDEGYLKIVPAAIAALLEKADVAPSAIRYFCFPCTLPRVADTIAQRLGFAASSLRDQLAAGCGDTGASHPLVMLVHALEEAAPGDRMLVGGRCRICGTLQFPKSRICVNPNCNAFHSQDEQSFADFPARVLSWSADYLTYSPDPPAYYGMVQFDPGGRLMADFTDVDRGAVEVGMNMRMVFRVKERDAQRGVVRSFWKAAPAGEAAPTRAEA